MARRSSHGAGKADGLPDLVAPVVTVALVDRDGNIRPQRSAIARDLLTPLPSDEFSIGEVQAMDEFLTSEPLRAHDANDWATYLTHCRNMLDAVAPGWTEDNPDYRPAGFSLIEAAEDASATARNILDLYDKITADVPDAPLLHAIIKPSQPAVVDPKVERALARRLGHSNPNFPLATQQRQVLAWLDAAAPGEVLAVNGPPGTGKTTLLLSAVAGLWVRAALEGGDPPVILAASSNNQAVTNIIDAFGKDFATGAGVFAGRWLPQIDSFGIFLPANSRRQEAAEKYQTEDFQTRIETVSGFQEAKAAWLKAATLAYPECQSSVSDYVAALQRDIRKRVDQLRQADRAVERLSCVTERVRALRMDPDQAEAQARAKQAAALQRVEKVAQYRLAFDRHLAAESIFTTWFAFLPGVERKRAMRVRLALGGMECLEPLCRVGAIDAHLANERQTATAELQKSEVTLKHIVEVRSELAEAEASKAQAFAKLGVAEGDEDPLDLGPRFQLFLLATHYWEGRWLEAMEGDLAAITDSAKKKGRSTVVARWHRRMMLTPCAVSTFASLPSKLSFTRKDGGKWATEYLYNFVDLLIIDEAGQVLPEVAAAAFALAKRALVIGDTQQMEPISSVPRAVDVGNLREAGLLASDADMESLAGTGLCSTSGSVMQLAQAACRISPWKDLDPGLWLFEHRRCHDEIISFSNALCYKGMLQPKRGSALGDALLPAMGYVHVDGRATRMGNSRSNVTEAQTIAAWIALNRAALEARYGKPVEQVVGIVTPFGAQVRALRASCAGQKIKVSGAAGITIGTVHALQGAERSVVIFSPVYSKHADGGFIDASPSMLNVTVSRAKDSFLLFGDMELLANAVPGSPRALLSAFLDRPGQELDFDPVPRSDLQERGMKLQSLRDAAEHDAFLLEALASSARRYLIVSPWIKRRTMERTGILKAMKTAVARGAVIEVYADPLLNAEPVSGGNTQIEEAEAALKEIGVTLRRHEKLHSKILATDDDLLCVGSFNWLSADRDGQYARHETSYVYRGPHVAAEIRMVEEGLKRKAR